MLRRRAPREEQPHPYTAFIVEEMILRDYLALDRTVLANDRTFLSYMRTALAFVIAGASGIHFVEGGAALLGGVALILVGLVTVAIGLRRYLLFRARIGVLSRRSAAEARRARIALEDQQQPAP